MKNLLVAIVSLIIFSSCTGTFSNHAEEYVGENIITSNTKYIKVENGDDLFKTYCNVCHGDEVSDPQARLAPPVYMIKQHYAKRFEDKDIFIDKISNWIIKPSENTTVMPGAIRWFNLMPPLALEEKDRKAIADYIFNTDFPEPVWLNEHQEQYRKGRGQNPSKGNK